VAVIVAVAPEQTVALLTETVGAGFTVTVELNELSGNGQVPSVRFVIVNVCVVVAPVTITVAVPPVNVIGLAGEPVTPE
jgi:hypothetical protein